MGMIEFYKKRLEDPEMEKQIRVCFNSYFIEGELEEIEESGVISLTNVTLDVQSGEESYTTGYDTAIVNVVNIGGVLLRREPSEAMKKFLGKE